MLRNKTFAPEFCSLISNWFDMREQAPGANLLHESVSGASSLVCTEICLPWNDVSPVGQSNWLILSFRAVHRHVGVLTRKQVSGASSLVCTGLYSVMQIMTAKSTLGTLYAHVVLHSAIFPQILCIVLYAAHVLPIKFFPIITLINCFELPQNVTRTDE